MVQISQELGRKYWALLASLARHAALIRSLACSLRSLPSLWESGNLMSQNYTVLKHSAAVAPLISQFLRRRFDTCGGAESRDHQRGDGVLGGACRS